MSSSPPERPERQTGNPWTTAASGAVRSPQRPLRFIMGLCAGGWTTVSRLCFRLWPDVASHTGGVHGVVAMVGVVGEGVRLLLLRSRSSANMAAAAAGWLTKEAGPAQSVKEEAICLCLRQRSRVFACLAELHSD